MMMMFLLLYRRETEARRGGGEYGRLSEEAERHESSGADGHSLGHGDTDIRLPFLGRLLR